MEAELELAVADGPTSSAADFNALYERLWWPMLRLAVGLVDETSAAEDVVQDAFAGLFRRWETIREPRAAAGYLRVSVVNGARSVLRRRGTARRYLHWVGEDSSEPADHTTILGAEHSMVRAALAGLPQRQREVLTLRYLAELPDADIALATGLSAVSVRSAASRGLAALRKTLEGM